jgi:hypothetical protein
VVLIEPPPNGDTDAIASISPKAARRMLSIWYRSTGSIGSGMVALPPKPDEQAHITGP